MLTMVNPIDFGGQSSKVKVTMVIIDKCGVRGDATLCVVIFNIWTKTVESCQTYGRKRTTVGLGFHSPKDITLYQTFGGYLDGYRPGSKDLTLYQAFDGYSDGYGPMTDKGLV